MGRLKAGGGGGIGILSISGDGGSGTCLGRLAPTGARGGGGGTPPGALGDCTLCGATGARGGATGASGGRETLSICRNFWFDEFMEA